MTDALVPQRHVIDDDSLAAAASHALASVLDAKGHRASHPTGSTLIDALLECAAAVGVTVPTARLAQARRAVSAEPLDLARQLGIPMRPVHLVGRWWQGDSGPYLVTTPAGGYAAALPRSRRYDLVAGPHSSAVSAAVAADLGDSAWTVTPTLAAGESSAWRVIRRALGMGSRYEFVVAGLTAFALAFLGLAVPLIAGTIVGALVPLDAVARILWMGVILVLVAVATFGISMVQSFMVQRVTTRIDVRATAILLLRLVQLPLSFFRQYSAGDLSQRLQGFDEVTGELAASIVVLASSALLAVAGLVVMVVVAPPLALLVILLLLVIGAVAAGVLWSLVRARSAYVAAMLALSGTTLTLFTGIAKLRVAGAERRMYARWTLAYADKQAAASRAALARQRLGIVAALAPTLVTLVVVLEDAFGAATLGLGQFTSVVAAAGQTSGALAGMLGPIAVLLGMVPLVTAMRPILAEPPEQGVDVVDPGVLHGEVELTSVSFAYAADQPEVLHDVSLRFAPGEFVAIVGPSGSGKSTLVRLLIGLEVPTSGGVLFDGRPLERLSADAVRRQIGVVVQSAQLASGTLLENIIGTSTHSEDDAWVAARLAGVADDIEAMPMGMRTRVSDGANTFSGGQKQRILLARALVRKPRIVVLDEATSALDNRTQAVVANSLNSLGATRIAVAHRLSTVTSADRIVVIDQGRVVESGTYDELLAAGGLFSELASRQFV